MIQHGAHNNLVRTVQVSAFCQDQPICWENTAFHQVCVIAQLCVYVCAVLPVSFLSYTCCLCSLIYCLWTSVLSSFFFFLSCTPHKAFKKYNSTVQWSHFDNLCFSARDACCHLYCVCSISSNAAIILLFSNKIWHKEDVSRRNHFQWNNKNGCKCNFCTDVKWISISMNFYDPWPLQSVCQSVFWQDSEPWISPESMSVCVNSFCSCWGGGTSH